jgi:mannitol 2-dehydrogenase
MFIDKLMRKGKGADWGICGVGVLPGDVHMRDALQSQGFEYTLVERHRDGTHPAVRIGSIVDYLYAPEEPEAVMDRLTDPATRIVSLTITEGGYNISDSTGGFDVTEPSVVRDAMQEGDPRTVFGIVTAGLRRRRENGIAPFTIMSCDNVEGNGDVARRSFVAFARMFDDELAEWIETSVAFPSSMVDRITPVTTDADREFVSREIGVEDAWPVLAEPFVQWVLEDDFPLGRPALETVGVQLVGDVRPYELMKLRLLNASHQAMAYFGQLVGHVYAHEAATDPEIVRLLTAYMDDEASPTLEPVPGMDLAAYKAELIERFANERIADTLARLATGASDRIPKFIVPVARERSARGQRSELVAAVIAGWARYAAVTSPTKLHAEDRQAERVGAAARRQAEDPTGASFLENADWFGELGQDARFRADFVEAYRALRSEHDPRRALRRILEGHASGSGIRGHA